MKHRLRQDAFSRLIALALRTDPFIGSNVRSASLCDEQLVWPITHFALRSQAITSEFLVESKLVILGGA